MAFLQDTLPAFWDWGELVWFVGVTLALNAGVIGTLGAALVMVERYGLFQNAKIQTQSSGKAQSDPDLWQCVRHLCTLHALQFPSLIVFYAIVKWRGMPTEGPLPPWPEIMLQLPIFYVIEDALFYWIHRLLHTRLLYKRVHKFHHRFHKPIGLAAEYTHPLELFLANTIPLLLGPLLFKAHVKTLWLWLVIRLVEGVDGHSGYDFWFMPYRYFPFRPGAGVHDFHHSHNVGNYGSFFLFWDVMCGTDQPYRDHMERKAEKERKD